MRHFHCLRNRFRFHSFLDHQTVARDQLAVPCGIIYNTQILPFHTELPPVRLDGRGVDRG